MFPGLIRTAATPASIARSARLALKWMSAITGIGESRTIFRSASASSIFGTAQRTTSQPGGDERCDLRGRRRHVVRRRQGHRLDDDGGAAADLDVADLDRSLAGHQLPPSFPMSFESPMKKSNRTSAMPTAETRS